MRASLTSGTPVEIVQPESGPATRGLVIAPDIMGLRPLFDAMVERLASEEGWAVVAVEPFPGRETAPLEARFGPQDDARYLTDLVEAADLLEVEPVGILGFCMGGMYVHKAAGTGRFDRGVSFYGMIHTPERWRSETTVEPLDELAKPGAARVLAVIGGADDYTPPAEVAELERVPNVEVVTYPEAGHGFVHDPDRPAHRPADAADAWTRALTFLRPT
ncbi:MAG TPA: dienelactone hydrolase family protein [Acidimicrobiales bacterium]|nr:dienelactone hydrolase family protein [Acidimicrobiales bacterium]